MSRLPQGGHATDCFVTYTVCSTRVVNGKYWDDRDGKRAFDLVTGYYIVRVLLAVGVEGLGVYLPSWSIYGTFARRMWGAGPRLEETEGF